MSLKAIDEEKARAAQEFIWLLASHRAIGVALADVAIGERRAPKGWRLDRRTNFFLPPELEDGNRTRH